MSQLDTKCLLLNRNWYPIGTDSVRSAFNVIFKGHADIMDENLEVYDWDSWKALPIVDQEDTIGTVAGLIRTPRVIRMKTYGEVPKTVVRFSRRNVFARDKYFCSYCIRKFPKHVLSLDHIIPQSRGGKTEWTNITTACLLCNGKKGNLTPEEAGMKLHNKPFAPTWKDLQVDPYGGKIYPAWMPFIKQLVH